MTQLTDGQVDAIARRLAQRLGGSATATESAPAPTVRSGAGVHPTVDAAVHAAAKAFVELGQASLETRDRMIGAIRDVMRVEGDRLARFAHDETGLGRYEDKVVKNQLVTDKTPGVEDLRPETWSGDRGLTLVELAPYGVIGAITPTTNPTSTIICNTIGMVAAGNTVVFNVHPSAVECSMETVRLINQAIMSVGGPENVVTAIGAPTIATAQDLMTHKGIRLLAVTGGAGVVKAAMTSGKRAICAGPGNPPVVVDETADIAQAGRDIVRGASFDNNIICVDEKEVFVVESVADELLKSMRNAGAYLASGSDIHKLETTIFSDPPEPRRPGHMNKDCIGKNAAEIMRLAGIPVDGDPKLIVCDVPESHPLVWSEQMMPVMPVVRVSDVDRAIDLAKEAEHGFGHSASMHSRNINALSRMAREMNTSIFVKNGPIVSGLGAGGEGFTSFTIASPTGEGLTSPISFSRQRRCVMVDHFRIV